jgi:hypothetical protein
MRHNFFRHSLHVASLSNNEYQIEIILFEFFKDFMKFLS